MEERLTRLLTSYSTGAGVYALARLEFALKYPYLPAPPLVPRPQEALQAVAENAWDQTEQRLDDVRRYLRAVNDQRGKRAAHDQPFASLQRAYRELDQYARAVRWLITVEDRRPSS
jgi:hypothetical protein